MGCYNSNPTSLQIFSTIWLGESNSKIGIPFSNIFFAQISKMSYFTHIFDVIRNDFFFFFLWILSMYKLQQITHNLNIKPSLASRPIYKYVCHFLFTYFFFFFIYILLFDSMFS